MHDREESHAIKPILSLSCVSVADLRSHFEYRFCMTEGCCADCRSMACSCGLSGHSTESPHSTPPSCKNVAARSMVTLGESQHWGWSSTMHKKDRNPFCVGFLSFGRNEATRTPDPYVPNVVRYQLRYIPISLWCCKGKAIFGIGILFFLKNLRRIKKYVSLHPLSEMTARLVP